MQTPFRSPLMTVKPEWIDINNHMNMAYYSVLFDQSFDEIYPQIGFGLDYLNATGCTTYVAEFHICYVRELHEGDQTYATMQLIDYDAKRFHCYQELYHADGWLAATAEGLTLHVDQSGPRVAPMPQNIQDRFAAIKAAHSVLPMPSRVGSKIGLKRK
jgi:acyl-CoA thioester hydrolase